MTLPAEDAISGKRGMPSFALGRVRVERMGARPSLEPVLHEPRHRTLSTREAGGARAGVRIPTGTSARHLRTAEPSE